MMSARLASMPGRSATRSALRAETSSFTTAASSSAVSRAPFHVVGSGSPAAARASRTSCSIVPDEPTMTSWPIWPARRAKSDTIGGDVAPAGRHGRRVDLRSPGKKRFVSRSAPSLRLATARSLSPLTDHELGAAAADVAHERPPLEDRQRLEHAEVDEAGLLDARHDLHLDAGLRARPGRGTRRGSRPRAPRWSRPPAPGASKLSAIRRQRASAATPRSMASVLEPASCRPSRCRAAPSPSRGSARRSGRRRRAGRPRGAPSSSRRRPQRGPRARRDATVPAGCRRSPALRTQRRQVGSSPYDVGEAGPRPQPGHGARAGHRGRRPGRLALDGTGRQERRRRRRRRGHADRAADRPDGRHRRDRRGREGRSPDALQRRAHRRRHAARDRHRRRSRWRAPPSPSLGRGNAISVIAHERAGHDVQPGPLRLHGEDRGRPRGRRRGRHPQVAHREPARGGRGQEGARPRRHRRHPRPRPPRRPHRRGPRGRAPASASSRTAT